MLDFPFLGLEGNPFIIRFKTSIFGKDIVKAILGLEGNPFIIRFKTRFEDYPAEPFRSLEGNPFIIRFKTYILG